MLEIENLLLEVDGRPVLKGLDLRIEKGKCHILLGPNGSGKTSLLLGILGFPRYRVTGAIVRGFLNVDIKGLPPALGAEVRRMIRMSADAL